MSTKRRSISIPSGSQNVGPVKYNAMGVRAWITWHEVDHQVEKGEGAGEMALGARSSIMFSRCGLHPTCVLGSGCGL